ncbi:hypothetical protein MPQ_0826 [Methylovorus sp. MP688]|nr:hypothetical protein MPQ_0826 [Methylovorus sp. MP688]
MTDDQGLGEYLYTDLPENIVAEMAPLRVDQPITENYQAKINGLSVPSQRTDAPPDPADLDAFLAANDAEGA